MNEGPKVVDGRGGAQGREAAPTRKSGRYVSKQRGNKGGKALSSDIARGPATHDGGANWGRLVPNEGHGKYGKWRRGGRLLSRGRRMWGTPQAWDVRHRAGSGQTYGAWSRSQNVNGERMIMQGK